MNTTHGASGPAAKRPDRDPDGGGDPSDGWLSAAVGATTLAELTALARSARERGELTPRDQAWCRALAAHLSDVDAAAMRELVRKLPVTGDGDGR